MASFCRYCGKPIRQGAKFCENCGRSLAAPQQSAAPPAAEPPAAAQPSRQVPSHSSSSRASRQQPQPVERQTPRTRPAPAQTAAQAQPRTALQHAAETAAQAVFPQSGSIPAPAAAGEIDLGELSLSGVAAAAAPIREVPAPISGLFRGIGSFLGGILRIFKKPGVLIGTVLLAAMWYFLARYRDSDSQLVRILSWLTYAEGGFDRSIPGAIGGVLGKGTAAAALISLFSGGLGKLFKGIGALFVGHGERRGFFGFLFGVLLGAAIYYAFAGASPTSETAMAGVAGAALSLEALGGGSGKLYDLAESLTSRSRDGVRTAMRGKCDGLLTGLTVGFALGTAVPLFL